MSSDKLRAYTELLKQQATELADEVRGWGRDRLRLPEELEDQRFCSDTVGAPAGLALLNGRLLSAGLDR